KIEEQVGMDKGPALTLSAREDVAEQLLGLPTIEEVLLVGSTLIGVAGRDRHADAELFGKIEERSDVFGRVAVVDGGVDVDGEALCLGRLDRGHRPVEDPRLADGLVVMLAQPVEVDGEEQILRWLEQ